MWVELPARLDERAVSKYPAVDFINLREFLAIGAADYYWKVFHGLYYIFMKIMKN